MEGDKTSTGALQSVNNQDGDEGRSKCFLRRKTLNFAPVKLRAVKHERSSRCVYDGTLFGGVKELLLKTLNTTPEDMRHRTHQRKEHPEAAAVSFNGIYNKGILKT